MTRTLKFTIYHLPRKLQEGNVFQLGNSVCLYKPGPHHTGTPGPPPPSPTQTCLLRTKLWEGNVFTPVCDFVQGVYMAGGMCGRWHACKGRVAWQGVYMTGRMYGTGHVWQEAFMTGGMHDGEHAWWGACMMGG